MVVVFSAGGWWAWGQRHPAEVTGNATEDGLAVTLDALANASDPDAGTSLSVVNVPATLPAGVTYNPTTHAFALDPSNAAYQHLAAGATQVVTVSYGVSDGTATTGASVSWTVTGTNDATSYLWQYASEGNAIPFTQVFIRPKLLVSDFAAAATTAPDSGLPASTLRPMLNRIPVDQGWAVTGLDPGVAVPDLNVYVKSIAQIGSRIYMGGKFLQVEQGATGQTFTQSYLAAFDVNTGEWIPTFAPVLNAPVWEVMASPDGTKLLVGGEFTSVNGVAGTGGLAALNPTTGAPVAASSWTANVARTSGVADVRAMAISGSWLYVAGNFTKITGGYGANASGPITVSRAARVRLSDGLPQYPETVP